VEALLAGSLAVDGSRAIPIKPIGAPSLSEVLP
jgi:hypothetical protein